MPKQYIIGEYDSICDLVIYKGRGLSHKDIINFDELKTRCNDLDEIKLVPIYNEQKRKLMFEFTEVVY